MWVKTQCGLVLVNLDNWDAVELNIEEENDICAIKNDYSNQLGVYATKERAVEVLDEIHTYMNTVMNEYANQVTLHVYQMPKE